MATRRQTFLIPSGMHMVSVRDNVAVLKKKTKKQNKNGKHFIIHWLTQVNFFIFPPVPLWGFAFIEALGATNWNLSRFSKTMRTCSMLFNSCFVFLFYFFFKSLIKNLCIMTEIHKEYSDVCEHLQKCSKMWPCKFHMGWTKRVEYNSHFSTSIWENDMPISLWLYFFFFYYKSTLLLNSDDMKSGMLCDL